MANEINPQVVRDYIEVSNVCAYLASRRGSDKRRARVAQARAALMRDIHRAQAGLLRAPRFIVDSAMSLVIHELANEFPY